MHATLVSTSAFVWGLQAVCDLHRIPFAPALALQQFAPPYSLLSLQRATEAAGLKSGWRQVRLKELARLPAPFVATIVVSGQPAKLADPPWGDKGPPGDKGGGNCRLAIVLYCDGQRISYIEEGAREPVSSTLKEFGPRYRGEVLLLAPAAFPLWGVPAVSRDRACHFIESELAP